MSSNNTANKTPKKELKTNEILLGELMMYSPHGALCQVFIIEAIRNYAERIASTPTPVEHGNSVISAIAWHGIAVDILARMKANYENPR